MEQGANVALVSDAGMPLVSDPGFRLVSLAIRHQIPVIPIPGASALLTALAASGLPNEEFLFLGFLPARSSERRRALEHLRRAVNETVHLARLDGSDVVYLASRESEHHLRVEAGT